jgi:hypothetical protein
VTNLSDHDPGSLRDAIATTPNGGTVDFQPGLTGTITLTTGELVIGRDITIEGPGAGRSGVQHRELHHVGFGYGITNPGILNKATVTVTASTFSGNYFGGIINLLGTMTITASTFSGNGAGIYNDGTLTIRNTLLAGNGGPDIDGPLKSLGHNLIGDGNGGSGYSAADLVGSSANQPQATVGLSTAASTHGYVTLTETLPLIELVWMSVAVMLEVPVFRSVTVKVCTPASLLVKV